VESELVPAWREVRAGLEDVSRSEPACFDVPLDAADRCLSPSDFGFHNALLEENGRLCFLDFEYAGWDDPAKLICDFLCQPDCPVPRECLSVATECLARHLRDREWFERRIDYLMPLYRIKWCCILLNEFVETDSDRRRFALGHDVEPSLKKTQLAKARDMLKSCHAFAVA